MSECKFYEIAEELKKRIIAEDYLRRLPATRVLSKEFNVSSRTIGKALQVLKLANWVVSDRGGVKIVRARHPELSRNVALVGRSTEAPSGNSLSAYLKNFAEQNGDSFIMIKVPEPGSDAYKSFGINPPLAGVVFTGTYTPELAKKLHKHGIPFVSANRLPESENASWADWDHTAEFTKAVEFLVAKGYRRLAFFQYMYPNLLEHWWLIQQDFDRVAREFQLRHPDLSVFVREHGWDCAAFVDFWLNQPALPEVVVRIGREADDLCEELQKHKLVPGRDLKILLSKFSDDANFAWAQAVWKLLERSRKNPLAAPKYKMLKPLRVFEWL